MPITLAGVADLLNLDCFWRLEPPAVFTPIASRSKSNSTCVSFLDIAWKHRVRTHLGDDAPRCFLVSSCKVVSNPIAEPWNCLGKFVEQSDQIRCSVNDPAASWEHHSRRASSGSFLSGADRRHEKDTKAGSGLYDWFAHMIMMSLLLLRPSVPAHLVAITGWTALSEEHQLTFVTAHFGIGCVSL